MKESNIQTLFGKYLKANPSKETIVYELKLCKGTALPFDAVKAHQIKGLIEAGTGLYHKISDSPIFAGNKTRFTKPKPFDCLFIAGAVGYVAICFYKPRKPKKLYLINIYSFVLKRDAINKKSITEEMADEIADKVIVLKSKY